MRRLVLVLCLLALAVPAWAQPVRDELIVGFKPGADRASAEALAEHHGGRKVGEIPQIRVIRLRVPPSALEAVERALSQHPGVLFVERDADVVRDQTPDDPLYSKQWHLAKIGMPEAWLITTGSPDTVIAILDSGVDCRHPDLSCVPGFDATGGNDTMDYEGHGTRVAGSAAAISGNAIGGAASSWRARVMPIKISTRSSAAQGLVWAADRGVRVANISSSVRNSSVFSQAAAYFRSKGGIVTASGGNCSGSGPCEETSLDDPNIIFVSATDSGDRIAQWSTGGAYLDLSAPGVNILTTSLNGGYTTVSGTSHAAPITAGVVALIWGAAPWLTPEQVEQILKDTSVDLGPEGRDSRYGVGRLNGAAAVARALGTTQPPPPDPDPQPDPQPEPDPEPEPAPLPTAHITGVRTNPQWLFVTVAVADAVRVELLIDGTVVGTASSGTTFQVRLKTIPSGEHTLQARAYDEAGNVGLSSTITFTR